MYAFESCKEINYFFVKNQKKHTLKKKKKLISTPWEKMYVHL